jgi:hypothetical protein
MRSPYKKNPTASGTIATMNGKLQWPAISQILPALQRLSRDRYP